MCIFHKWKEVSRKYISGEIYIKKTDIEFFNECLSKGGREVIARMFAGYTVIVRTCIKCGKTKMKEMTGDFTKEGL